jgi:hypothetical protein
LPSLLLLSPLPRPLPFPDPLLFPELLLSPELVPRLLHPLLPWAVLPLLLVELLVLAGALVLWLLEPPWP